MNQKTKRGVGIVIAIAVIAMGYLSLKYIETTTPEQPITIGVITPLTGPVAFWGESTAVGVELAKKELAGEGLNVKFVVEDAQLDPKVALSAAQKLVNIDGVDAIYSEFNPAAIAVTSFLKDKNILHVYDAAPISPLAESQNVFKTYLDYEKGCRKAAETAHNAGIKKVGVLKMNLEFGDLCLKGVQSVFGNNTVVEEYNAGETNYRTALTKLHSSNVEALFNIAFQPEMLASLRQARELGMSMTFVSLSENVTPDVIAEYSKYLEGAILFGLPIPSQDFVNKINGEFPDRAIGNYQAAALAYIHTKQLAYALQECNGTMGCAQSAMANAKPEILIGFTGFTDRIAGFDVLVQEWKNGELVTITQ